MSKSNANIIARLQEEFSRKVHAELGDDYNVAILANSGHKAAPKELQKIYPHFCEQIGYSDKLKQCIEGTVDKLFESTGNAEEDKKPGLLLGKIQSGKTRAFVGCMARAFDEKDVSACIILTKGTIALVNQTISRMKYDFRDCLRGVKPKTFKTVAIYDIMKKRQISKSLINNELNIFVCKKEKQNMDVLIDVFCHSEFNDKKILVIDDEADFVSRSFQVKSKEIYEGMIASQIDTLLNGLPNARYLQVTATPYALYLQPNNYVDVQNGRVLPFRPRFTSLVPVHDEYIGSDQYFGTLSEDINSMYSCLYHEVSKDCVQRLSDNNSNRRFLSTIAKTPHLKGLRWSIMHYIVASAIRQMQEDEYYYTSFIMHVGTRAADHDWECLLLEALLDKWTDIISNQNFSSQDSDFDALFVDVYSNIQRSEQLGTNEFGSLVPKIPSANEVRLKVEEMIVNGEYEITPVNSDSDVSSMLDDDGQLSLAAPLNIFVGGFVLDRGITINHLLGFFYGRDPQMTQQATVLQHCRMYGSRSKADMAVTRLHATKSLYGILKKVNQMDDLMRSKFELTINDPKVDAGIEFIHCDKAEGIIPCNPSTTAISDLIYWKPSSYVLPKGMQTANNVDQSYGPLHTRLSANNERSFFNIQKSEGVKLLEYAGKQFEFSRALENIDEKQTIDEMIALLNKLVPDNGTILCYYRLDANLSRKRQNGDWIDAPVDGQIESPRIKAQATDKPVLIFIEQRGNITKGWKGNRFYWPVICLPKNVSTIVYCR